MNQKNWAGNLVYNSAEIHTPTTITELQTLIRNSEQLKVLGTRHSFNHIADTTATHVTLGKLPRVFEIDANKRQVRLSGDLAYGEFSGRLHEAGFALHNLASLPHISVAGACATATHGSGDSNGNLATQVAAIEMVSGTGDLVTLRRGDADFDGAVVNLGALGAVITLTLDIEPTYQVRQWVYRNLPFETLYANFDAVMSCAYSVSLFTNYHPDYVGKLWIKQRADANGEWAADAADVLFGAVREGSDVHPLGDVLAASSGASSAESKTPQNGVPGAWHNRLPHFRMDHTPSHGDELQTEYFVPREHAVAAIRAVHALREHLAPLLYTTEIRTIAADTLWMSMAYRCDSMAIHFTWKPDWPGVRAVLPLIEEALAPYHARPHWGKLFTTSPKSIATLYTMRPQFQQLVKKYDPHSKLKNSFLAKYVMNDSTFG